MRLPRLTPVDDDHRARICDAQSLISGVASTLRDPEFGILFGSFASGSVDSDVDFKIVVRGEPTRRDRSRSAALAHDLNARYGARAYVQGPTDVPLSVKTVVSARVVESAIALDVFGKPGPLKVPHLDLTAAFLTSDHCQMRTILSALTTPNVLIFGSTRTFDELSGRAFCSLRRLVGGSVWDTLSLDKLVDRAMHADDGRCGKAYLGYIDKLVHREWLRQGFAAVANCA